jgi:hypothetical protein
MAAKHAVDHHLILHNDDECVQTLGFEKTFFFGNDVGQRRAAVARGQPQGDAFLGIDRLD